MSAYAIEKVIWRNEKEIKLRNLEPADAEKYHYFADVIGNETTHTLNYPGQILSQEFIEEKFRISLGSNCQLDLGGFDKDGLIAHLSFCKPRPQHPFEKHVGEFGIKIIKDFQSLGVGSEMLLIMEDIARKMEIRRMQARVRVSNDIGINFYKKHCYEIEGRRKQAAFINGSYEDEFYISKILN